jgi:DNA modification methylase
MKYPCLLTKKISEISSAKYNPRKITDEAMGRLTKSLAEFGNIQPITWNVRTGNVVGGHQRLKVYKAMGKTEVDVWAVDLDEQKEKAANIALNKLSGEFDMPMLKDILEEIDTGDLDMEITGFGMDEIALMMEDAHPEVTEDEVPEVPVDAITKPGDLWLLGEHRLLCGDATKTEDVERLMNGEKAQLLFTDPPYNVGFNGRSGKHEIIKNDNLSKEDFESFIQGVCNTIKKINPDAYYIWCNWNFYGILQEKLSYKTCIVWAKNVFGLGVGYRHQHEFCLFNGKIDEEIKNESDLWEMKKDFNYVHPTQKPVALSVRAIKNHRGLCNVVDLFGGSGSTLMGAEQTKRRAFVMELDANYCDVIVKRWENLTGKKATLAK